jgi:hypothetical protein
MTGYAPAGSSPLLTFNRFSLIKSAPGYVTDPTQFIRGISPLHDSGTGSSLGEDFYFKERAHILNFIFFRKLWQFRNNAITLCRGFNTCTTTLTARQRLRKPNTDGK